ncbi:hypothetical protein L226DRAFT_564687 [Lentinus tigrinus ALCF2SS1-7]|uniref:uncharacterized protein n=1 Tax=Lentinus tigrinus ALCF2SS1-7 TaxID=1328758 RepID=UPI0011662CDE|nr:hypothetical protein L226DRAFT_564687 [Lentinus tigrinus ALCF2SS1-7]
MTDSDFSTVLTSEFVSFTLETLLAGVFVVTYGIAVCILLVRDRARWHTVSFLTSTAMLLLALVHLGLEMYHCFAGFVIHGGTRGGITKYLTNTRNPVFIAKSVVYVTQTLLGDTFMAYRIYILWNSSWVVVIGPALLICSAAVTGYASSCMLAQDAAGRDLLFMNTSYSSWFLAYLSTVTVYTVFSTGLVAFRIYRWKRRARRYNFYVPISPRRVLETFIHSAAIYPVVLISLFVTYVLGVNPEMFGVDLLPALMGIATTLITIRLGIVDVTQQRSKANNLSARRLGTSPRILEGGRYTVRRPPPSKAPTFEPQEFFIEIDMGDPSRNSSATGFGQDLLLAVERVLGLHYSPSDEADGAAHSTGSMTEDETMMQIADTP